MHSINITAIYYARVIVCLSTISKTMIRQVGLTKVRCVMPVERHDGRRVTLSVSRQLPVRHFYRFFFWSASEYLGLYEHVAL